MEKYQDWLFAGASSWALVPVSAIVAYIVISVIVRIVGLRSFSKMSATDFVTTVALGSLLAAIVTTPSPSLVIGILALLSVFAIKYGIALAKRFTALAPVLLENDPVFLMRGSSILHHNLDKVNVSLPELHAKLREANVWNYEQVVYVVMETTGDVSVIHKSVEDADISEDIFDDVAAGA